MEQKKQNIKKTKPTKKENFFKKNWHIIVISVLLLFSMSQCMKRCSKNTTIQTQTQTIDSITKQNDTLKNSLNYYTALFESEKNHNSNFASIATGNQAELYSKINALENKNAELEKKIQKLEKENKSLRDTIAKIHN